MSTDISSTPGAFRLRWDVFLSFRGTDTRKTFIEPLYNTLHSRGVRVFRDDDGLERGEDIAHSLLEAIDDSAASIVVLSPNYASSRWCLEELVKICDCGRLILPVFYKVEPYHVRRQKGDFEKAFKINEEKFERNMVLRWREAMTKVGDRSGFPLRDPSSAEAQATLIRNLVEKVSRELRNTPLGVGQFTVGLDHRVEELAKWLEVKSNGFRVLGLYGMGGVGKTTLAKTLFNNLVAHFEHRTFIPNVREASSKDDGLVSLQKRIIGELADPSKTVHINDISAGVASIRRTVQENRVLIVLDDVDNVNQLDSLIGRKEWFYEGSRVVISTRDRQVLVDNNADLLYEVKELGSDDALELFSYHALRRKKPTDDFLSLSKQIVKLTGGLPLALEVFGSFLFDKRRVEEWVDALDKLRRIRPQHLQDVLRISYDGLDQEERTIFLDIACLLVQMAMKRDDVIDVMRGCGFSAEVTITVLTARCLIKIAEDDNTVVMHDQIRDMGRQIVTDESPTDRGMRSRLWDRAEILTVLRGNKGTRSTQGITLDFQRKILLNAAEAEAISGHNLQWMSILNPLAFLKPSLTEKEKEVTLQTKSFESMMNLRLLQINNMRLEGKFTFLPAEMKWLQWQGCPFRNLPSDFWSQKFTVLDLSYSKIERLWGCCWRSKKVPKNLKVLNLSHCYHLTYIPDLSGCTSLDKIVLERCLALTSIHESTGSLNALHDLNLSQCSNLKELPNDVSGLKNLEKLLLSGCSKLTALPANIGHMKSLRKLLLDGTAIDKLPESIFSLEKLENLILDGCKNLKRLPNCIGNLTSLLELSLNQSALEELPDSVGSLASLEILHVIWCRSLTAIPESIGNLKSLTSLSVHGSAIRELPSSIGSLSSLKELSAGQCKLLSKLPDSINGLASIVELQLDGTLIENLPDQIGATILLRKLEMRNCSNLKSLPESIGSLALLTTLDIRNSNIEELPESIGLLENLVALTLNKCKMLRQLPTSIGKLKMLHRLKMEETSLTDLPETFGSLSSLMTLEMANRPHLIANGDSLPAEAEIAHSFQFPTSFYDLTLLYLLDARAWRISGKIPDDFEKLSSLETLDLSQNNFHSLPSSLKGLSILKTLSLRNCSELIFLPSLPSSLIKLNAENCTALESVSELTNLESLQELNLTNCAKLLDIPGLECLKSLRWLFLSDCIACSSQVRKRFSKFALRNLSNLSMPGSRFPEWFSGQTVNFTKHRNRELKGVIVCVVLSINHDIPNDDMLQYHHNMPGVVDVEAHVLKSDRKVYSTALYIRGVPKTNQEHIHLCRFADFHQLVHFLRDGGTLCVTKRNPPVDKRLELKNSGIHLIFEGDDDYGGDENYVDQSLKSVSQKMAEFFNSLEDNL